MEERNFFRTLFHVVRFPVYISIWALPAIYFGSNFDSQTSTSIWLRSLIINSYIAAGLAFWLYLFRDGVRLKYSVSAIVFFLFIVLLQTFTNLLSAEPVAGFDGSDPQSDVIAQIFFSLCYLGVVFWVYAATFPANIIYVAEKLSDIEVLQVFTSDLPENTKGLVFSFYEQSAKMMRLAIFALIGVGLLIVLACLAVVYSGELIANDQTEIGVATYVTRELDRQNEIIRTLKRQIAEKNSEIASIEKAIENGEEARFGKTNEQRVADAKFDRDLQNDDLKTAQDRRDNSLELEKKVKDVAYTNLATSEAFSAATRERLIASAITRFGLVVVIFFLAHALINLYRYAIRLSAFYWSIAMALVAGGRRVSDISNFVSAFSPLSVALGKEPKSPTDEAIRLIQAMSPKKA